MRRQVQWELWHICREALANAVRHSGGHQLRVTLTYGLDALDIEVTDDGPGWGGRVQGRGHNGLENMRRRAEGIGGRLEIDAGPGHGTRVHVSVPGARAFGQDGEAASGGDAE